MTDRERVARSFGQAAASYDEAAELQTAVAQVLAKRVLAKRVLNASPAPRTILEVGCGTGGLTRLLLPRLNGRWIVTDLSPGMVAEARRRLGDDAAEFRVMDGESPDLPPASVDLIVSNLAAQWFGDLPKAMERLRACLAPGGRLVVTTLGADSLAEWKQAVANAGYRAGTPPFVSRRHLTGHLPAGTVHAETLLWTYPDAFGFLRSLKDLGASTPAQGHHPLPIPAMRQAMKSLPNPCRITYEILTVDIKAAAAPQS
jgi:malonyl-CoA O-methyltransferase